MPRIVTPLLLRGCSSRNLDDSASEERGTVSTIMSTLAWRRRILVAIVGVIALFAIAVPVVQAAATHRYWVAGWVPGGDHLLTAIDDGGSRLVVYGIGPDREDVIVRVSAPRRGTDAGRCTSEARGATPTT